jgi:hypothetical protein
MRIGMQGDQERMWCRGWVGGESLGLVAWAEIGLACCHAGAGRQAGGLPPLVLYSCSQST